MRIALPKGRLLSGVERVLERAGYRKVPNDNERNYTILLDHGDTQHTAKLLKPRAIPQLLALGRFDVGFCGIDLIREAHVEDETTDALDLDCNRVRIVVAAPLALADIATHPPRRPILIASEYPNLASAWAFTNGLAHILVHTYGSTEAYAPDDADIIVDCVETGATLAANGLVELAALCESTTHCMVSARAYRDPARREAIEVFVNDIEGASCFPQITITRVAPRAEKKET